MPSKTLEIVRLGIPRLGTGRKQKPRFQENAIWLPVALRIALLRSSALQNDGRIRPVMLQCRTPQETDPKGHWGPHYFFRQSLSLLPPCTQSWYTQSPVGEGTAHARRLRHSMPSSGITHATRVEHIGLLGSAGTFSEGHSWALRGCGSLWTPPPPTTKNKFETKN